MRRKITVRGAPEVRRGPRGYLCQLCGEVSEHAVEASGPRMIMVLCRRCTLDLAVATLTLLGEGP